MKSRFQKRLIWIFRLIFGVSVLWYLGYSGRLPLEALQSISIETIFILLVISFLMVFLIAIRLSLLFSTQKIDLPWGRSFNYCCLGLLTALFIPSALSADLSKGLLLAKDNQENKTTVLIAVVFDRALGSLALGLTACLFMGFIYLMEPGFLSNSGRKNLTILFLAAVIFTILGFGVCLATLSKRFWKVFSKLFDKLEDILHSEHLPTIMERFRNQRNPMIAALGLSLLNHLLRALAFYVICRETGMTIDFFKVGFIISLASFVNVVPISPGNFGAGDAAFGFLFSYLGQTGGAVVSLVARVAFYLPAFYGAAEILFLNSYLKKVSSNKTPDLER